MEKFEIVTGIAAPLLAANIDTDVIMPKQFLKGIDRNGLDQGVFFDLRFNLDKSENENFILNQKAWRKSSFLVVGPNFGCGSSREHAVWGIRQLGIRALIGTSFAGIFNDNCQRNGVLTICLEQDQLDKVSACASNEIENQITVNLIEQKIVLPNEEISFEIDALKKQMLVNGLDAVGFTLQYADEISKFEDKYFKEYPWFAL
ncbi:3-isopropylmalate dehydratase small subunit [Acinetobacter baumannii]|uniref:3-isopropylmalate dehydratase small subunit n=1 Tax=Acinetobacter baumannii TaxID=470 RepID=UPI000F740F44|nr:3-isopropylmalate dehydratase small subunit [Acinetobacter baumannii]RSQ41639.1 3-isopropylmalate dehydratase small subunit [Acinetobacter baumannii]